MSKRKPFVIYQMFWLGTKWKKWTEYATQEEADLALVGLRESPSGKYYGYELRDQSIKAEKIA